MVEFGSELGLALEQARPAVKVSRVAKEDKRREVIGT
jgi:hypothetical protein